MIAHIGNIYQTPEEFEEIVRVISARNDVCLVIIGNKARHHELSARYGDAKNVYFDEY